MRVLCSCTPMEGVFGPFVPLGKALLDAGHEVVVATGSDLEPRVSAEGFTIAVAGPTALEGAVAAMADPAAADGPGGDNPQFAAIMFGRVIAAAKLPRLRHLAEQFRPDLIVHPPVDLAAPIVAAQFGVRCVTYGFGQLLAPDAIAAMAERVAPLWREVGREPPADAGIFRDGYLDPRPPSLRLDRTPVAAITRPIRPEVPGDPNAQLPDWVESLGVRPAVYLSLGTVPFFNQPEKFVTLLADLAREDIDLVVTVGELNDPVALGPQPDNVHVERWLPLAPLLSCCDAVVCHGGSGTTLAALSAGLPLVLVPQGADQFTNAAACHRAGVARVIGDVPTSAAVRDAVSAVLAARSPEGRAAHAIAAEIAAMPAAHEVARDLARLVGQHREPAS